MPSSTSSSERSRARRALFALVAVFAALNAMGIGVWLAMPLSPVSEERYLSAVEDHIAMLEASKGKKGRIILLGGSGVAFSVSAQTLGEQLDRPVFNGGIQAGIGFRNLIDLYAEHLDPEEDVIVLLPEFGLLEQEARYSQVWCDVVFLRKVPGDLMREPRCVPFVLHRTWQELRHHLAGTSARDQVYRRSGFNAVGDLTSHLSVPQPKELLRQPSFPAIPEGNIARVEDHVRSQLIDRGFDVIYIPAPMANPVCERSGPRMRKLIARLSRLSTLEHPAHDLEAFCYPLDAFFDGAGHLGTKGRPIHTENVRRVLAEALANRDAK